MEPEASPMASRNIAGMTLQRQAKSPQLLDLSDGMFFSRQAI